MNRTRGKPKRTEIKRAYSQTVDSKTKKPKLLRRIRKKRAGESPSALKERVKRADGREP